ncbi:OmpA family protein [Frigidibacter oleivorans]|uniref:OmpA family protein n=1 Tax=Frigidibacter oleivorans TaxID=2487129 RepID=UPI000F8D21C1|nr:OmpA family protein [Frigidibacter oleivorans]
MRPALTFPACAALALLVACNPNAEVGSQIDGTDGAFGTAATDNVLIHSGERDYVVDLTRRFAAAVPPVVNFAFNSAQLDPQAQAILRRQADFIRQFPELRFRVYGHTDLVGTNAYNKSLGLRRAQAVVAFLGTQGISTSRLEAVVSFGETRPLVLTQAPEERNRRTVTEVSGFVRSHPTLLNGKYAAVIQREYVASATQPHTVVAGGTTGVSD